MGDVPSGAVSGVSGVTEAFFSNYSVLGRSQYFVFYRARRYGRWYVLKGLKEDLRANALYEEWLYKEYSIGVSLDHPNIVRIESIEDDPVAGRCIVMEWVDGQRLDKWLEAKPSRKERKAVLSQLLDAVEHCHRYEVFHRDIKPSNILITRDGRVKLNDFGLSDGPQYAALKQSGGTNGFAAPEQQAGESGDQRADIYALGRIVRLVFPHGFRRAVRKAAQSDPSRRQQSVDELRRSLRPRWWISLMILLLIVVVLFVAVRPSGTVHTTMLASGQVVAFREVQRLPRPEVAIVGADTSAVPLAGRLVLPSKVRHWGISWRVVAVEDRAFRNAVRLTSVVLPPTLCRIGEWAFAGCISLSDTLVVPASLEHIGLEAFNDCSSLTTVLWRARQCVGPSFDKVEPYPYFFRCLRLREAIIDTGVEQLPIQLFSNIRNLERLTVREGLVEASKDLAASSHNLRQVSLPATMQTLGYGVFYETALDTVVLPDALEEIGPYAFAYCDSLRVVCLGRNVRRIDSYCFTECSNLRNIVVLSPAPPEVQHTTFNQLPSDAVLCVPSASVEAYRKHPFWGKFATIVGTEK